MRRRTVFQRIQQEAELLALLLFIDTENTKYGLLHFTVVNTHRTAAHFIAVNHHIVSVSDGFFRRSFQFRRRHVTRGGERMVHRGQTAFAVVFEHREVNHPQRRPFVFVGQAQVFAQFQTQRAQRIGNHFFVICAEEDHVAVLRAGTFKDSLDDVGGQELGHRTVNPVQTFRALVNFDIRQSFRAVDLNKVTVIVDLLTAKLCAARHTQRCHAAFRIVSRAREDRELYRFQQVSDIYQFHRVTQVWLVGTVATFRFGKRHDREIPQIHAFHFQPQMAHQRFHHFAHLWRGHEGGLDVDLSKLRLTVST